MASKRKSTTPCMVRTSQVVEQEVPEDVDKGKDKEVGGPQPDPGKDSWTAEPESSSKESELMEVKSAAENQSKKLQGGYECKYCPFSTQNLNEFTEHVDMQHPNVILNPLYVCAECNFTTKKYDSLSDHNAKFHPGETNFKLKLIKRNNQTVLEQSIEGSSHGVTVSGGTLGSGDGDPGISMSKTPIMKLGKPKVDAKKAPKKPEESGSDNHVEGNTTARVVTEAAEAFARLNGIELLQDSLGHVMPSVQLPPNINLVPKVPVPLNSTKYNCALDTNATMINSFNKFPYPTQAELSWLTAASKHPEEHIRIWFATQRLKHGISWSPEEVEEARKKMFNGTIQSVPQTITVLPAQLASTKMSQPILQTALPCQILGQTSLVLTQVTNGSTVSCSPITLAVAGMTNHGQKRPLPNLQAAPEPKRAHVAQVPEPPPKVTPTVLPPTNDRKKTKEQIAELKASFLQSQFPDDAEVYRLIEVTGLARSDIKKWFSDHRYRSQRGIVHITSESLAKDQLAIAAARHGRSYHAYPDFAPQKFKEKTQGQLKVLEESFMKSSFPTQGELDRLRSETKLSRREIDTWFSERRKLRDSMEQAVLDSMGPSKKSKAAALVPNGTLSRLDQLSSTQLASSLSSPSPAMMKNQEQIHLLKSTFTRTQWPTPQEYDQLAAKTGLVRTEIVRWFKENRCSLKTGTLKWIDQYQQQHAVDGHSNESVLRKGTPHLAESPKNGGEMVQQYFKDHKKLSEEDLDKLVTRAKAGCEKTKDSLPGKTTEAASDRSEGNSRDGHGSDENEESHVVDWVEVTVGEDDGVSDCTDSWSQAAPEGRAESTNYDSDSEGVTEDTGHV